MTAVPAARVRKTLFDAGATDYSREHLPMLVEALGLDGVVEIKIPHATAPDGAFGRRGAEIRLELTFLSKDGDLLGHAESNGRLMNVIESPAVAVGKATDKVLADLVQQRYRFGSKARSR